MRTWFMLLPIVLAAVGCAAQTANVRRDASPLLSAEQLLAIADVAARGGDRLRAQQYLQKSLRDGAPPERVLPRLLQLYLDDGQYRLAIDTLRDHLHEHPRQPQPRLLLGDLYAATQLTAAAIDEYERVLELAPDSARAHFALASLLHELGSDPGRADRHFRAYLASAPAGRHADEARSLLLEAVP